MAEEQRKKVSGRNPATEILETGRERKAKARQREETANITETSGVEQKKPQRSCVLFKHGQIAGTL